MLRDGVRLCMGRRGGMPLHVALCVWISLDWGQERTMWSPAASQVIVQCIVSLLFVFPLWVEPGIALMPITV